jgi:hypothetical protein
MKRSGGITACAVIVILGSALLLLIGGFGLLGIVVAPLREGQPHFMKYFMGFFLALALGVAGWGIASGVGLLRLKEWARISILVFSGMLLFMGFPGLLMIPFMPQPPDLPENFTLYMRIFMAAFFGLLAALGVWWIVYFNRKSVRAQFQGALAEGQESPGVARRPLSIAIIGWYMVVSAFCTLPFLFLHMPMFLMGFMIKGWASSLFMLACGVLQLVAGAGLLKLKPWSRILAIGYFSFFTLSTVMMVALPGSQARYEEAMRSVQETVGAPAPPSTLHFPMWFGLAFCLPLFAVVVWFLVTQKKSFLPANQISAPLG